MNLKQMPNYLLTVLLYPLSLLWGYVYRVRRFCYNYGIFHQNSFKVPIISIGNLTFGGTGKTPFTLWLSNYLGKLDKRVLILMRGYKGKLESSSGILRSGRKLGYNPFEYGDEALLLARRLEKAAVVVGKKRSENLEIYFDKEKPDVVLLDDGHQHLKLRRNLNFVLFDALMPLEKYKNPPLGYMREGFSALKDADVAVIGRSDQVSSLRLKRLRSLIKKYSPDTIKIAEITYKPVGFYNATHTKMLSLEDIKDKKVICIAGIASPDYFFKTIENLGGKIVKTLSFPDHHYFSYEDIRPALEYSKEVDALVVTTEKDIVKMRKISEGDEIYFLEIDLHFFKGEQEIMDLVQGQLS